MGPTGGEGVIMINFMCLPVLELLLHQRKQKNYSDACDTLVIVSAQSNYTWKSISIYLLLNKFIASWLSQSDDVP